MCSATSYRSASTRQMVMFVRQSGWPPWLTSAGLAAASSARSPATATGPPSSALRARNDRNRHSPAVSAGRSANRSASSSNFAGKSGFNISAPAARPRVAVQLSVVVAHLARRPFVERQLRPLPERIGVRRPCEGHHGACPKPRIGRGLARLLKMPRCGVAADLVFGVAEFEQDRGSIRRVGGSSSARRS